MRAVISYLVDGLTVTEIADDLGTTQDSVRDDLRAIGISISANADLDLVTESVRAQGFNSFHSLVSQNGFLRPIKDQARELGVSRYVLAKFFDAYRRFLADWKQSSSSEG